MKRGPSTCLGWQVSGLMGSVLNAALTGSVAGEQGSSLSTANVQV